MKLLLVANWKMNPQDLEEAKQLFNSVKKGVKNIKSTEVVICPPFLYLSNLLTPKTYNLKPKLGAQDCFWEENGAYTGEISPAMLKNLGVEYIILGHSERRRFLAETNEMLNKKIKKVLFLNIKPILCIGETQPEKEQGIKEQVLAKQIKEGLKGITREEIKNIVIAYEPVWAIGTGQNCLIDETMSSILLIRKIISRFYNREIAKKLKILYGGSVTGENAADYIKEAGANGLLIGSASLKSEEFVKIINSV